MLCCYVKIIILNEMLDMIYFYIYFILLVIFMVLCKVLFNRCIMLNILLLVDIKLLCLFFIKKEVLDCVLINFYDCKN